MRHFILYGLLLMCVGCYDSSFDETSLPATAPTPTTTLAELHRILGGGSTHVESNWVVEGCVTANDQGGNFYHSILIEEAGAALELSVALEALHNDFPIGTSVVVQLEGLTVGRRFGILQAGVAPTTTGYYPTDPIRSKATLDQHLFRLDAARIEPQPTLLTISALKPSMAGRLIRIADLTLLPEEEEEDFSARPTWEGYHTFADEAGNTLRTYVNSYADFADQQLPAGPCTLTGILQYDDSGEGHFIIKPRNEEDYTR